jgi:anti-sigma factor RsiW
VLAEDVVVTHEELEFLISQHLDGTLDAAERVKLDDALAARPEARELLAEHARLDALLKSSRAAVDVDAEWLSSQIAGRIDEDSARSLLLRRWMWMSPIAAAAMLMIALTIGFSLFNRGQPTALDQSTTARPQQEVARIDLAGPQVDTPRTGGGYAAVSVGIPANLTPALVSSLYLSDGNSRGRVLIRPAGTWSGNGSGNDFE